MSLLSCAPSLSRKWLRVAIMLAPGLPRLVFVALRCLEGIGLWHSINLFAPADIVAQIWAGAFILGYILSIFSKRKTAMHQRLQKCLHASSLVAALALAWDYASRSLAIWGHVPYLVRFSALFLAFVISLHLLSALGEFVRHSHCQMNDPSEIPPQEGEDGSTECAAGESGPSDASQAWNHFKLELRIETGRQTWHSPAGKRTSETCQTEIHCIQSRSADGSHIGQNLATKRVEIVKEEPRNISIYS